MVGMLDDSCSESCLRTFPTAQMGRTVATPMGRGGGDRPGSRRRPRRTARRCSRSARRSAARRTAHRSAGSTGEAAPRTSSGSVSSAGARRSRRPRASRRTRGTRSTLPGGGCRRAASGWPWRVRACLADAFEDGLIRSNPAAGVRVASATPESAEPRAKALSEEELGRLVRELRSGGAR